MNEPIEFEPSSGNVFADLGLPDPETSLAKAKLAQQIAAIIGQRGWTQTKTAEVLGVDQPKVSALVRGRLRDFSVDRLLLLITRLGYDVNITVAPNEEPTRGAWIAVHGHGPEPAAVPSRP